MSDTPILEMIGISKSFPGVHALQDVSLSVNRGQVVALLGANGAGKSTLIKLLCGIHRPDTGQVLKNGTPIQLHSPQDAIREGIGVIHQEFQLVPTLTARENIFLGTQAAYTQVRSQSEHISALELFKKLGVLIDPEQRCSTLSISQQQIVEIAKAIHRKVDVLILDEPTAALSPMEASRLLALVKDLANLGLGIIYISHRMDEIEAVADRIVVLRDGKSVFEASAAASDRNTWISAMVGRTISSEYPPRSTNVGETSLSILGMTRKPKVDDVSLELKRGEVVGLTGLVGAGRTELLRLIFGADRADAGQLILYNKKIDINSPADAIRNKICLLTEDRKHEGLILSHSIEDNFGLPNLSRFSKWGWMMRPRERKRLSEYAADLSIQFPSSKTSVQYLSGGNQQKIVMAKWLETNAEIILLDEPTRGVDVAAKREIYVLIHQLASAGKSILMVSSEFPEILGVCHRIVVMRAGRIAGQFINTDRTTEHDILQLAVQPESESMPAGTTL